MITYEQAEIARDKAITMPQFSFPPVSGIGIGMGSEGYIVVVNFIGESTEEELPEEIDGVKVAYHFNVGIPVASSN